MDWIDIVDDESSWDGNERRRSTPLTMRDLEEHIDSRVKRRLEEHARSEAQRLDARFDELKTMLKSAFPGGDPEEHRRYHDEVIEFMRERRELWKYIRDKSLAGLVWAALLGIGSALWHYTKAKIGTP